MIDAQKLHDEFVRLGGFRLRLKNKMLAILPEIYESGIWKKYAGSIEEYAGKYGDCKAVSITKKIELNENSSFLFMKLKEKLGKNLSDKEFLAMMLEERAKEEFPQTQSKITDKVTSPKSITAVAKHTEILRKAQDDSNEALSLKNVTGDINEMKLTVEKRSTVGRYIPSNKKHEVIAQTYGKCAYPNCHSPYEVLHHTDRYSESRTHNSIIPLCKIHHEFAHHNLIQNETLKTDEWRISVIKKTAEKISQADLLYRKYRRKILV